MRLTRARQPRYVPIEVAAFEQASAAALGLFAWLSFSQSRMDAAALRGAAIRRFGLSEAQGEALLAELRGAGLIEGPGPDGAGS
ncbi:MAG: hypothetical protein K2X71_11700 [Methylobacterium sp.]|uniref:hypothetical protein n=1 Tax=Methylobacterium sp. TaxID=409 RepID=UPI0025889CE1|nr:hypothetical protein [Methylobacterium sp.]MBY0296690.1 hypothetical protein [Methylobacterium sp.]